VQGYNSEAAQRRPPTLHTKAFALWSEALVSPRLPTLAPDRETHIYASAQYGIADSIRAKVLNLLGILHALSPWHMHYVHNHSAKIRLTLCSASDMIEKNISDNLYVKYLFLKE
jgi:hypothetical protein